MATRGRFSAPQFLRLLNRKLLALAARRRRRQAVFLPPRHAKSTTCSHYFPAQYLGAFPHHRVILAGHTAEFTATFGRKVRDTLTEWGPAVFGVRVRADLKAADEWELAGTGGGMKTAGIGGNILGRGADLLILDDPIKNAEDALSKTLREKHWEWYLSTAATRLEPGACELLIMHRWHADDLGGRILKLWAQSRLPYDVLRLPALAEADDPLGRPAGAALWPERYDEQALAEIRERPDGAFWWDALYQQRPTPEGGAIFKAEWFGDRYRWDRDRSAVVLTKTGRVVPRPELAVFGVLDPSVGKNERGDALALAIVALARLDGRPYLLPLHVTARRVDLDAIPDLVAQTASAWGAEFVGVEANGYQVSVARAVARRGIQVRQLDPDNKSKLTRAVPAVELAHAGQILLPAESEGCGWVPGWLEEHTQWTGEDGDVDNQVDTTAYAARIALGYSPGGQADRAEGFGGFDPDGRGAGPPWQRQPEGGGHGDDRSRWRH